MKVRRSALSLVAIMAMATPTAYSQTLRLVGQSDLGGDGLNGAVAVVGSTAIVGAGAVPAAGVHAHFYNPYACPATSVKIVDLSRPEQPRVVSSIPVPAGIVAQDVAALRVRTAAFTGDLAAVALAMCGSAGNGVERGVAYYDISHAADPKFLGRYQADADNRKPDDPACGPPPDGGDAACAASQHSVSLVQRADGRVLSISVEPGASASKFPSGDLRIVDVSNPRNPRQLAAFPPAGEPVFSSNGCRPFRAAHSFGSGAGGTVGVMPFYDGGFTLLDLRDPESPVKLSEFTLADDRAIEGNLAYAAYADLGDRRLVLTAEQDWIAPVTTLRIDAPASAIRTLKVCEAIFTLFDPGDSLQLYRRAAGGLRGDIVYVGRGCPAGGSVAMHAEMVTPGADPYLADPAGKIALVDRSGQPTQPGLATGSGCSMSQRVQRAQAAGAIAVMVAQTSTTAPEAFSPDGDPTGITIPLVMLDRADGDSLRTMLCPGVSADRCSGGMLVSGTLTDAPGEWGALRVVDVTRPDQPVELAPLRAPQAAVYPPPDLGVYSVHHALVRDRRAYVAWNSGGLRVLDLTGPEPREIGAFVPPDVADPQGTLPGKAYVVGVATMGGYIVATDINSGLYVLEQPPEPAATGP